MSTYRTRVRGASRVSSISTVPVRGCRTYSTARALAESDCVVLMSYPRRRPYQYSTYVRTCEKRRTTIHTYERETTVADNVAHYCSHAWCHNITRVEKGRLLFISLLLSSNVKTKKRKNEVTAYASASCCRLVHSLCNHLLCTTTNTEKSNFRIRIGS